MKIASPFYFRLVVNQLVMLWPSKLCIHPTFVLIKCCKLGSEKEVLNLRLSQFKTQVKVNSKDYEFEAYDSISDARIAFNRHSDYHILLFSKFEISKILGNDFIFMKLEKGKANDIMRLSHSMWLVL